MLAIKDEKKAEYIELIYDLIFVYIIGRNNSLLHHTVNGFVTSDAFVSYVLCTLAIIQIWSFGTFYLNRYGRFGARDCVFLFLNMYLLYHIADAIHSGGEQSFWRFNIAWALILTNIGVQYFIETRNHHDSSPERKQLCSKGVILLTEAALVGVNMLLYSLTGVTIMYVPILFGIIATVVLGRIDSKVPVDFAYLAERVMLYVVFTFGEMIIVIASYFSGDFDFSTFYFSLMAFLIVVGLFLCYGTIYNRIIDKEKVTNGTGYMLIHVFLIFALNNLSVSLEFMQDEKINLLQKTVLLVGSFALYFLFLALLGLYSKKRCAFHKKFIISLIAVVLSFIVLMLLFREQMYVNIAITVVYVFGIFIMLFFRDKKINSKTKRS